MGGDELDCFSGVYDFLSNFYESPLEFEGVVYPTLEHAFQAAKTFSSEERAWIGEAASAGVAKRRGGPRGERGRRIALRSDWEEAKVGVMRVLLAIKFSHGDELSDRLLETGERELVEGNSWGDVFWGVYRGRGENWLGRLLMERRDALRSVG